MSDPSLLPAFRTAAADALSVFRGHIVFIAMAAALVFGWLMTGRTPHGLALVVGLDWFFINLMNRVTDVAEDTANGIRGAGLVARHRRLLTWAAVVLMLGSFAGIHWIWPALTPWRVAVQLIGLGYNYRIVPTPHRGLTRFKELYFFKNSMSAVLFVLTCFVYPIAAGPAAMQMSPLAIGVLVVFFVPFELTYEILYDLRDLDGDRAQGVPTYPVMHGTRAACRIIDGLLFFAAAVLASAMLAGWLGLREGLMVAAPAIQCALYRPLVRRGLTARHCVNLTHLGTGLLLFYLAGNALWLAAGLPPNLYLVF